MQRGRAEAEAQADSNSSEGDEADGDGVAVPEFQRKRRKRTTAAQLALLENHFATDMLPSNETRAALAARLGMSPRRVQIWFQNKRAKNKRIQRESQRRSEDEHVSDSLPQLSSHPINIALPDLADAVTVRRASLPDLIAARHSLATPVIALPKPPGNVWPRTLPSLAELQLSAEPRGGFLHGGAPTAMLASPVKLPPLRNLTEAALGPTNSASTTTSVRSVAGLVGNAGRPFSRPSLFTPTA